MDAFAAGLSPKLYRKNPFRLLGLPSDAKRRSIKRRTNSLVGLIEAGDEAGLREEVIGGFTGLPDEPVLREASHRLEEPEIRLLDEIFWFRPDDSGGGGPLGGSDAWPVRENIQRWIEDEAFGGPEASLHAAHNLAVFYHLIAVEIELKLEDRDLDDLVREGLRDDAENAWSAALGRWRRLADDPAFLDWLRQRSEVALNGQSDDGGFDHVSQLVRDGALAVMAGIALDHARHGQPEEVARLRTLVGGRGETGVFIGAAERLVQPRIEQQMRVIRREKETLQDDKPAARTKAEALYGQLRPVIDEMSMVLGHDNRMLGDFGDALAELVNQGVVTTLLATEDARDYPGAQAVLLEIRPMGRTGELRDQIDRNLCAISCHFCRHDKGRPREESRDFEVKLFRINRVENVVGRVHFQTLTINVPRCASCRGAQHAALGYYEVRDKLLEGWFPGAEPTDVDSNAFVASNGNPAVMHDIPEPRTAIWERAGGDAQQASGDGLFSRISGLFGSGAEPQEERAEGNLTANASRNDSGHSFADNNICQNCGCSRNAIEKFGWGCN